MSDQSSLAMEPHNAVLAVALCWYDQEVCRPRGKRLTMLAADNIRSIAATHQIHSKRSASELGFNFEADPLWPLDALRLAKNCVRKSGGDAQVQRLCASIASLNVENIENNSESHRMTLADAVMIFALVYFMDERNFYREEVTVKAAMKIAAMVSAIHGATVRPPSALGLYIRREVVRHVPEEVLLQACALVLKHQAQEWARAVIARCKGKSVASVEQMEVQERPKISR